MGIAEQLQRATERQEYSEAAHLLEAVQQLSAHFQSFAAIPKVDSQPLLCIQIDPTDRMSQM